MSFPNILRLLAIGCFVPVVLHVVFGVAGDALIGAPVPDAINASLDSQNRFYGASFAIYGALLWYCARDLRTHVGLLKIVLVLFFFGGCARGLSAIQYGPPSPSIIALWAIELIIPPLLLIWLRRQAR
ncbi:MAG: hypothetical protein CFE32_19485 [Alphaproteobacteria bacterium PA3]|jgi:hypothetical protein|nr:MAG: hypothetical protein CFE32_19485 [Alphaproteobacteria bacterium PA3]